MKTSPYLICMVLGSQVDACEDHIYVGWQVKYFGIGHQTLRRFVYCMRLHTVMWQKAAVYRIAMNGIMPMMSSTINDKRAMYYLTIIFMWFLFFIQ